MDAVDLLANHFHTPKSFAIVLEHSRAVAELAFELTTSVPHLNPDIKFINEAAILHDIGACGVNAPEIDCHGPHPYICHGIIGAEILLKAGYPLHARVCECHIGVGLTTADIASHSLPLPKRNMVPQTIEEIAVSLADLFYSKKLPSLRQRKSLSSVRQSLAKFSQDKSKILDEWLLLFPNSKTIIPE